MDSGKEVSDMAMGSCNGQMGLFMKESGI